MRRSSTALIVAVALALAAPGGLVNAPPARASVPGVACKVLGTIGEGWWGKACDVVLGVGGKVIGGGKKLAGVIGKVAGNPLLQRGAGIAAIVAWVLGGAKWTMDHMASVISSTTSPALTAGWFTAVYLRIAGLALFFTLLFICAAAAEAILRSDSTLLARAIFAYLPLAALLTALAAPVTMLLLAATDQLSAGLAAIAGKNLTHFLTGTSAWVVAGLTVADPFFAALAGGLVVAAGGALWVEMLIRQIAVYVVVAMLPVVFAGMVWPARRVWAIRAVEVLVALILAKVAIVAVLALGGAALAHSGAGGISRLLAGLALVVLGAFSPWLLLRLIPLAEVASAAVGHIRGHVHATAGVRTPEAALASKTSERVRDRANGVSGNGADTAAGGVAVTELLEQMHRRAQAAETTSASPTERSIPTANAQSPDLAPGASGAATASTNGADSYVGSERPAPAATVARGQTTVQRSDGTSEALPHTDPQAPIPPPPSETPDAGLGVSAEEVSPATPPPVPDPQDGRLGGDKEAPG